MCSCLPVLNSLFCVLYTPSPPIVIFFPLCMMLLCPLFPANVSSYRIIPPYIKLFLLLKMLSLYSHCIFIDTKNSTKSSKIKKTCKKSVTFSLYTTYNQYMILLRKILFIYQGDGNVPFY